MKESLVQPVHHNKGRGMCYPVCEIGHIKEPLILTGESRLKIYGSQKSKYKRSLAANHP